MAISVKTFINPLNCDEPAYEVPVIYSADAVNGASTICGGGGTTTNVYGDYANLAGIASNSSTGNAANTDICQDGMDVVFVVDYTGSMSGAITGVKNGINNIVTEIQSQSNGNYRLGLVLFDGPATNLSNTYGSSDFYQNLPSTQKIATGRHLITCVEKMSAIGNQSTFATHLSYIDSNTNSATGMVLGSAVECGGEATSQVVQNSFAGQWRSNVLKLIILITDDTPDQSAPGVEDATFFNNLTTACSNNDIQVFSNIENGAISTTLYEGLSNNTSPAGQAYTGLNFSNSNWVTGMINGITTLCVETTTYTCDPAPAGWYTDSPLQAGATVYYWDGSGWTNNYTCQYTVRVNLVDNITNGSVDDIALNHPNYHSIDTFTFTGAPGSTHSATIGCSPANGYTNLSVNVSNVSDTNVITNTSVNNLTDEVTITVTIPNQSELNHSIQINGNATQIQRTVRFDVVNNTNDLTDSVGGTQAVGQVNVEEETPASGWLDVSGVYNNEDAIRYTFTGVAGATHAVDVNFLPNPSDYSINVNNVTVSYYDLSGNTSQAITALGQTAIANLSLSGSAPFDYTGNLEMPAGDVWVKVLVNADINEPSYRYTLYASENITGAQMQSGDSQHIFEGYTGETFNFEALIENSVGYTGASATSVSLDPNLAFTANGSITTGPTINSGNTGAEGVITMPSGGGTGGIIISGQATQIVYSYVITIDSSAFSTATWSSPVTLTGVAGSTPSVVVNSLGNNEYNYNLTGISSSEAALTASISNATSMAILLDLEGGMPIGGGSATVTVTGSETQKQYTYTLSAATDNPVFGSWQTNPITLTGTAGQVLTGNFNFAELANNTYSATGVSSNTSSASGTLGTGSADLFDIDYSVTMPSGGGSGTLTIDDASHTPTQYSYTVNYDNTQMTNGNNLTVTPQAQNLSGSAGQVIPFTIDLDPSPSYYAINIQGTNNISTHDGGGSATSAPELVISGYNQTTNVISGDLTMPAGGGTGYVRPKGGVTNPSYTYDVTLAITGSNVSCSSNTHTFTNTTGTANSHTFDLVADPGYTYVINNITHNGGAVLSTADNSGDVDVDLAMPNGGGSATVTVSVTATATVSLGNIVWDEGNTISGSGAWDTGGNQFSGVAGSTHTIDNTWRIQDSTTFYSQSGVNVAITGTDYPGKNPFSGLSSQTPTSGTTTRTQGTFTMPVGGGTWTFTIGGATQTTLSNYKCSHFLSSFNVSAGSVGSALQYTWNGGPAPVGLNLTTNPSTYSNGSNNYTASFTVPTGYVNSGATMSCTFTATGTTTTQPALSCSDLQLQIATGIVGDTTVVSSGLPAKSAILSYFTIGAVDYTTLQSGTHTYFVDIAVAIGAPYSNAGGSIVCPVVGIGNLPTFTCTDANYSQYHKRDVGVDTRTNATVSAGTITAVSPSTYQSGTNTYTATITVPSGYSNSGQLVTCTDTAVGDPCTSAIQTGAQNGTWTNSKADSATSGWGQGQTGAGLGELTFSLTAQTQAGFSDGTNDLTFSFFGSVPQSGNLQATYASNYTWILDGFHAGTYTIVVTNGDGCTGVYTDVTVTASNMPQFNCETNSAEVYSSSASGGSNQPGSAVQILNPHGYSNISSSPSTYGSAGTSHVYTLTFDLPDGYQPGNFGGNGSFTIVNGVGRVTCSMGAFSAGTSSGGGGGSGSGSGSGGGKELAPGGPEGIE